MVAAFFISNPKWANKLWQAVFYFTSSWGVYLHLSSSLNEFLCGSKFIDMSIVRIL